MKTQGFTLTEAIITVSILALLAVFAVPGFQNSMARSKVQKTSDLVVGLIGISQSEALQRNIKTYFSVANGEICIGTTALGCDLRKEKLTDGITLTAPDLIFSPFYGMPSPVPAVFTVTYSGVSQTVNMNKLGMITIGPLS